MRNLTFLISLFFFVSGCKKEESQRPNILWITLEDTSPQFIANYGCPIITTPVMDELGRNGVIFTNAYATGTVCSPSRTTIITGCPTEVLGTGNHRINYPIPSFIKGFPYYLQKAGYYTSNNVKTDYNVANEKAFIQEAWNESSKNAGWWNRREEQPFFSVFNFINCHQSRTMTRPWLWYKETILDQLPDSLEIDPDDIEVPPFYNDSKEMRFHLSRVHNSLRKTDLEVSDLLAKLEKSGLKDNTIIFIFSDHGEGIPRGKTNSIGFGHRVPFYVWFPDKYKHLSPWGTQVVTDELISFEDLAPTILSLAGCKIPEYMKGRPFMGELRKEPVDYVYGTRNRVDDTPGLDRTVFDGRFVYKRNFSPRLPALRYMKYMEVSDIVKTIRKDSRLGLLDSIQSELLKQPSETEYLYDIHNDVWEINNLVGNPNYQNDLERLRQVVKNRIIELCDIHFLPERLMLERSKNSTAYEIRKDYQLNPIGEIIEVADLVGRGTSPKTFFSYMKSGKEEIRYWASVGLNNLGQNVKMNSAELQPYLYDSSLFVRIEIAILLYKNFKDSKAKKLLDEIIVGDDPYATLQTMQGIIYLPEIAKNFIPSVKELRARFTEKEESGINYSVQNSSETFLNLYNNEPLYFLGYEKWMPEIK